MKTVKPYKNNDEIPDDGEYLYSEWVDEIEEGEEEATSTLYHYYEVAL